MSLGPTNGVLTLQSTLLLCLFRSRREASHILCIKDFSLSHKRRPSVYTKMRASIYKNPSHELLLALGFCCIYIFCAPDRTQAQATTDPSEGIINAEKSERLFLSTSIYSF